MNRESTQPGSPSRAPNNQAALAAEQWLFEMPFELQLRLGQLWYDCLDADGSFATDFYSALFAASPPVAKLFPGDMETQQGRLVETLGEAVRLCARPEQLVLLLRAAGVRHHHYRVKQAHFKLMEDVLMETLRQRLGSGFSADDETLFREWFGNAALVMRHAMAATSRG